MENLLQFDWSKRAFEDSEAVIVDVRTLEEIQGGVIENAIHIDVMETNDFIEQIKDWDKNKKYFLYCQSGGRSGTACRLMSDLGFKHTYNLQGGILDWMGKIVKYDQ